MSPWKFMDAKGRAASVEIYHGKGFSIEETAAALGAPIASVERIWDRLIANWKNTDEGQPSGEDPSPVKPPESPACDGTLAPAAAEHAPGEGGPDGGRSTVAGAMSDGGGDVARHREGSAPAPSSPPPQIKRQKVTRPVKVAGAAKIYFTSQKQAKRLVPARAKVKAAIRPDNPSPDALRPKRLKRVAATGELRPTTIAKERAAKRLKTPKPTISTRLNGAKAEPLPLEPKGVPEPNEVAVTIHLPRRVMDVVASRAKKAAYTRADMIAVIVSQACK